MCGATTAEGAAAGGEGATMKTHHKWMIAIALAVSVAAWLAWTMLTAESDLAPHGHLIRPQDRSVASV